MMSLLRFLLEKSLDLEISDLLQPEFDFKVQLEAKNMPTIASKTKILSRKYISCQFLKKPFEL